MSLCLLLCLLLCVFPLFLSFSFPFLLVFFGFFLSSSVSPQLESLPNLLESDHVDKLRGSTIFPSKIERIQGNQEKTSISRRSSNQFLSKKIFSKGCFLVTLKDLKSKGNLRKEEEDQEEEDQEEEEEEE